MRRFLLVLAGVLLLSVTAKADTFNFTITGTGGMFSRSGTLIATSNGNGSFLVTDITGPGVLGLIPPNDPFRNDNLLFPNANRLVDNNGIGFFGNFGLADLFSTSAGYRVRGIDLQNNTFNVPVDFTLTSTPEPSSLVFAMTGMLATAAYARRRITA